MEWKKGDICYFIENRTTVKEGQITLIRKNFCMIKLEENKGVRLDAASLFHTYEEALAQTAFKKRWRL